MSRNSFNNIQDTKSLQLHSHQPSRRIQLGKQMLPCWKLNQRPEKFHFQCSFQSLTNDKHKEPAREVGM